MRNRIEPHQTSILEREQERKNKIAVLVRHLLHLTTKLRSASGVNQRSLLAEINVIESALKKVSRGEPRQKGTSARTTRRSTIGRHETY